MYFATGAFSLLQRQSASICHLLFYVIWNRVDSCNRSPFCKRERYDIRRCTFEHEKMTVKKKHAWKATYRKLHVIKNRIMMLTQIRSPWAVVPWFAYYTRGLHLTVDRLEPKWRKKLTSTFPSSLFCLRQFSRIAAFRLHSFTWTTSETSRRWRSNRRSQQRFQLPAFLYRGITLALQ